MPINSTENSTETLKCTCTNIAPQFPFALCLLRARIVFDSSPLLMCIHNQNWEWINRPRNVENSPRVYFFRSCACYIEGIARTTYNAVRHLFICLVIFVSFSFFAAISTIFPLCFTLTSNATKNFVSFHCLFAAFWYCFCAQFSLPAVSLVILLFCSTKTSLFRAANIYER